MAQGNDDELWLDDDGKPVRCWCGAELSDASFGQLADRCGGTGSINCFCGGDFCVCHHHGTADCTGCDDCDRDDWPEESYDDDDED